MSSSRSRFLLRRDYTDPRQHEDHPPAAGGQVHTIILKGIELERIALDHGCQSPETGRVATGYCAEINELRPAAPTWTMARPTCM